MQNLKSIIQRYPNGVGYNEEAKELFGKAAKRYIKLLSKALDLSGPIISWSKSGIACSGDVSVKGMINEATGIYIVISHPSIHGVMFRTIKNLNDHTGGGNNWYDLNRFDDFNTLARYIKQAIGGHNG